MSTRPQVGAIQQKAGASPPTTPGPFQRTAAHQGVRDHDKSIHQKPHTENPPYSSPVTDSAVGCPSAVCPTIGINWIHPCVKVSERPVNGEGFFGGGGCDRAQQVRLHAMGLQAVESRFPHAYKTRRRCDLCGFRRAAIPCRQCSAPRQSGRPPKTSTTHRQAKSH